MLELYSIHKEYTMSDTTTLALNNISLSFKANEFVSILGKSGSGKTTLLNIIGGLDRYTSGDLRINGRSTKDYKDKDWDAYRNQSIGFVFQSYNLIAHLSILANVELALTLSGVGKKERIERAREALQRVGLSDHIHKKPNQLSGGQMQRVSIARALVNDPEIILADEPTGALDSKTSVDIMNLLQHLSKEKLIIMVTHNNDLAKEYSSRIIQLVDGEIISDQRQSPQTSINGSQDTVQQSTTKTSMSFITAFNLSLKNLLTKKTRTLITAFAGSIGIIGIALVLLVSNGFNMYIDNFQTNTLSGMPITISETTQTFTRPQLIKPSEGEKSTSENITTFDPSKDTAHENTITKDYLTYIDHLKNDYLSGKTYTYGVQFPVLYPNKDAYTLIDHDTLNWTIIPESDVYAKETFTLLSGKMPTTATEVIVIVNDQKQLNQTVATALHLDQTIDPSTLIDKTFKILPNNLYYQNVNNQYIPLDVSSYKSAYDSKEAVSVKIVGVVQEKSTSTLPASKDKTGIAYTDKLSEQLISLNYTSDVAQAQRAAKSSRNVLTDRPFVTQKQAVQTPGPSSTVPLTAEEQYTQTLHKLGATKLPMSIDLYPKDFTTKEKITDYLNDYNDGKTDKDTITYTDLAKTISNNMNTLISSITAILIAFSTISLVVSSIMIGIITYVSVVERTKEIGILRSLGARKKDVSRVFNAETLIIGLTAGTLGVGIAWLISFPATHLLQKMLSDTSISANLSFTQAALLILVSMVLTLVSGLIPARIATQQDPVKALRSE